MARLTNAKHEAFARSIACGESASDAYKQHIARPGTKEASVWEVACRLRQDIKVASRIRELREALDDTSEFIASKQELMQFCTRVLRTPIAEINEHSDLGHEVEDTKYGKRVKAMPKGEAITLLGKMRRYFVEDEDKKNEVNAVASLLATVSGWAHKEHAAGI